MIASVVASRLLSARRTDPVRITASGLDEGVVASAVANKLASAASRVEASPATALDVLASAIARRVAAPTVIASPGVYPTLVSRLASAIGQKAGDSLATLTNEPVDVSGLTERDADQ